MKKLAFAAALALPLAVTGCGGFVIPADVDVCAQALIDANTSSPAKLAQVAWATPACVRLGSEALNKIIENLLSKKPALTGVR